MTSFSPQDVVDKLKLAASDVLQHDPAKTVADLTEIVKSLGGTVTKNLLFKDGRQRYYLCSCCADTVVDHTKVLPLRLGIKKGELKMADPSDLQSVLNVGPGSATPLAACQDAASRVILLLDQRLKESAFWVHPLENTKSVKLTHTQLEEFLRSHGREAHYVDFSIGVTSELKVGKDNPPDLKALADSVPPIKEKAPAAGSSGEAAKPAAQGKAKPAKTAQSANADSTTSDLDSVPHCVASVLELMTSVLGTEGSGQLTPEQKLKLTKGLEVELNSFRNAAYARGLSAAKGTMIAHLTREWR